MREGLNSYSKYILYDYLQVAGGAERLTLILANKFRDFQVITSRSYPEAELLLKELNPSISNLGNVYSKILSPILEAIYCFQHRTAFLEKADIALYSGFYAPLAIINQKFGKKIYYCHTPPRFAYDLVDKYSQQIPVVLRPLFLKLLGFFRKQYEQSLLSMDTIYANSLNVQKKLENLLGIKSQIIYPPVDLEHFTWLSDGDYYVSLARLTAKKRVDLIIEAFRKMPNKKLIVLSGGPEYARLRLLANTAPNIFFTNWLSEKELSHTVGHSRAAIYIPIDEDFGMSSIEAMAAGKPVIGVREGGLIETIDDKETGLLIPASPSVENLIDAVSELESLDPKSMRKDCIAKAKKFSTEIFLGKMGEIMRV